MGMLYITVISGNIRRLLDVFLSYFYFRKGYYLFLPVGVIL